VFLDTGAHARYFEQFFRLPGDSIGRVFVGAETDVFSAPVGLPYENPCTDTGDKAFTILFYGQFIPLHGIETIIDAAGRVEQSGEPVRWLVVGRGQEAERIDTLIGHLRLRSVERLPWVPHKRLVDLIRQADVCLGIFGTTGKAARVIPNKVYQALAAQRPLITADTPAIRELLEDGPFVHLVPPGDAESLASTVLSMKARKRTGVRASPEMPSLRVIGPKEVGEQLEDVLATALSGENVCSEARWF
jgi:glycosyltransferase involved in cell wall biosynthesis